MSDIKLEFCPDNMHFKFIATHCDHSDLCRID